MSANPNNKNQVFIDARAISNEKASTLATIEDIFSNGLSAIAATEFLNSGSVARIPADVSHLDILSLAKQWVQFIVIRNELQKASTLSLGLKSVNSSGAVVTDTLSFDIGFQSVKALVAIGRIHSKLLIC